MIENPKVGKAIKQARIEKMMTQADLAVLAGVSIVSISRWENGLVFPHFDKLAAVMAVLGLSASDFKE